jgi:phospho-N-acetylmuramoyl-pentapeptide-transferase
LLYWLLFVKLYHYFPPFRIFRYLTFRTAFASLTALFTGLIVGPVVINRLREFQIGQYIREEGPKAHQKKAGTPTMGGLLIAIAIVVPTLLWADLSNVFVWLAIASTCAFAAIGFADDYIKVVQRRNLGLTARAKLGLQFLTSLLIAVTLIAMQARGLYSTKLIVPFVKQFRPDLVIERWVHNPHLWPLAFIPFVIFVCIVIVGSSNAVNLTDGLDGLAIGCTVIAAGALTVLTYVSGHAAFASYLELQRMPQIGELTIFCGAMVGSAIAGTGRRHRNGGSHDQAGTASAFHWWSLRDRSALGDPASGVLQAAQEKNFQDGSHPSSFRADGMVGVQGHCPLLDRVAGLRPVRTDDVEVEVETFSDPAVQANNFNLRGPAELSVFPLAQQQFRRLAEVP